VRVRVPAFWQPLRVLAFSRAAARASRAAEGSPLVHSFSRTLHQDVYRAGGGSHADYLERAHGPLAARARRLSPRHAVLLEIERRVFADPRQWIQCGSGMVRDEIARRYGLAASGPGARLVVIPNGVDVERFDPERNAPARAALRGELGAAGGAPVWLLLGSGWLRKGLDTALAALARARDPSARLWVAGRDDPAPWRRRAERLGLAERVRFLGPRPDPERLLAAADGLLLPTRYDAFANAALEAAAAARPVVTSGANGAAECVAPAAAVIADPEDTAGFAAALDRLADPGERARLGAAGRRLALEHSWPRHVERLRALYARVAR
jgi:UDP-glucose:(heptosyl)LPS alpha-1,3-glucosyltransferase